MPPGKDNPGFSRPALVTIILLAALLGGVSGFLPPLISLGIIAGLAVIWIVFAGQVGGGLFIPVFIFVLYGNLLKYITGARHSLILIDLLIILLFLKLVFHYCLRRKFPVKAPVIEFSLLVFFGISLVQIFNPNIPSLPAGMEGFRKTTFYMIGVFIGIGYVKSLRQLKVVITVFIWACVPIILYGLKQSYSLSAFDLKMVDLNWASIWTHQIYGWNRPIGIFSGPFHYAMICIIVLLCCLYIFMETRKKLYLAVIVLPALGVLLAMTRINLVALFAASGLFLCLWFVFNHGVNKRKAIGYGIIVILLTVSTVWIAAVRLPALSRTLESLRGIRQDSRFLMRFEQWEKIYFAIREQPVIGYGMGSAGDALENIYEFPVHLTSHNLGLLILIETGIPGLFFYSLFVVGWLLLAFQGIRGPDPELRNISILIVSIFSVTLINGITGSAVGAFPINYITWLFMGALVKLLRQQSNPKMAVIPESQIGGPIHPPSYE